MRRAARVDDNQVAVLEAARAAGATVQHLFVVGRGCPDAILGYHGHNLLIEIKSARGRLSPQEAVFHTTWCGQVAVVRSVEDVMTLIEDARREEQKPEGFADCGLARIEKRLIGKLARHAKMALLDHDLAKVANLLDEVQRISVRGK